MGEIVSYAAIARLKDVEADELAQQIKKMEKEVPAETISDIEDELLGAGRLEVVAMPPPWRVRPGRRAVGRNSRSRHAVLKKITERSRP